MSENAAAEIAAGYATEGAALELGAVVVDAAADKSARVRIPFATLNRHGLVAGATGTGKTKTLQNLAEQCSAAGVPVLLADVKGDLSGLARPGEPSDRTTKRAQETGDDWAPTAFPVRFLSLGASGIGVPVRATITAFGPILLSKVLGPQRHAGVDPRPDLPLGGPEGPGPAGHQGPARGHPAPALRRGQGRAQGHRRGVGVDRRASSCGRW